MEIQKEFAERIIGILDQLSTIDIKDVINAISLVLPDYDILRKKKALAITESDLKSKALRTFFVSKKIEGLAESSLRYYAFQLRRFFEVIEKDLEKIEANDIRYYLAKRQIDNPKLSKTTLNNERRVLNSFFSWCQAEEYITKNPTAAIRMIKQPKRIKKAFSEIEMEKLREACSRTRDKAMIEVLYSTGVRCEELSNIAISDIDNDQIYVIGKGDKERVVYLNAKAQLAVHKYLSERDDDVDRLFVSIKKPYRALSKSRIEGIIKDIGEKAGVNNAHPHRFRRTAATIALNRGMPIEQVQQMLGHESIGTTTLYARSSEKNVKESHRKYVV